MQGTPVPSTCRNSCQWCSWEKYISLDIPPLVLRKKVARRLIWYITKENVFNIPHDAQLLTMQMVATVCTKSSGSVLLSTGAACLSTARDPRACKTDLHPSRMFISDYLLGHTDQAQIWRMLVIYCLPALCMERHFSAWPRGSSAALLPC